MQNPTNIPTRQVRPLVAELAGLAGAGKTTLLQELSRRDGRIRVVGDLELRKSAHAPIVIRHLPFLLSALFSAARSGGRFTLDEMKALIYLNAWPDRLMRQDSGGPAVLLLNHGPVFKLATLHAFGPTRLNECRCDPWWTDMFERWRNTLDALVWLDAPEDMLLDRINVREKRHVIKGKPEVQSRSFLDRYRTSYEQVLAWLTARGRPALHRIDTGRAPIARTADELLVSFGLRVPGDIEHGPFVKEDRPAYDLA